MKLSLECLPCLLNQAVRLAKEHLSSEQEQSELVREILRVLANVDNDDSAPQVTQKMQRLFKEYLQNDDPYREAKHYYNTEMLKLEQEFEELVNRAEHKVEAAMKLAAAGNIIDFGPGHDISRENVMAVIRQTLEHEFASHAVRTLKSQLQASQSMLYLGDNAGEIVFDKIFIRTIKAAYPQLEIWFAARGEAVLNDITEDDAYFVGMDKIAYVINNGTDIPGTALEHCSVQFRKVFRESDVIIAKGQGNFESLHGCGRKNLHYLFLCKCDLFTQLFGAAKNGVVLMSE